MQGEVALGQNHDHQETHVSQSLVVDNTKSWGDWEAVVIRVAQMIVRHYMGGLGLLLACAFLPSQACPLGCGCNLSHVVCEGSGVPAVIDANFLKDFAKTRPNIDGPISEVVPMILRIEGLSRLEVKPRAFEPLRSYFQIVVERVAESLTLHPNSFCAESIIELALSHNKLTTIPDIFCDGNVNIYQLDLVSSMLLGQNYPCTDDGKAFSLTPFWK